MKKKPSKPTIDAAWIGEFALGATDRATLRRWIDDAAIARIEELVAEHAFLYRPHLQNRPTAPEIREHLLRIHEDAKALRESLRGMDAYVQAQLEPQIVALSGSSEVLALDVAALMSDLDTLAVVAKVASDRTKATAGAGTRGRGQRPVPDALLVSKIAVVLAAFDINVRTESPGSDFVVILQAVSNSGGFESNDVRGSIRAYLDGRM